MSGWKFWLACAVPTFPMLFVHLRNTASHTDRLCLVFALLIIGAFYHVRKVAPLAAPKRRISWFFIVASWGCVAFSAMTLDWWWSGMGLVGIIATALSTASGRLQSSLLALVAPLFAFLKLPFGIDRFVESWIESRAIWFSSIFLDWLAIPHSTHGHAIQLIDFEVLAGELNQQITSFYVIALFAFLFLAWKRMSLWTVPLYAGGAIFVTMVSKTLQIVMQVFFRHSFATAMEEGWQEYLIGASCVLLSIGLLYSLHHLLAVLMHHVDGSEDLGLNPIIAGWGKISWLNETQAAERTERYRDDASESPRGPVSFASVGLVLVVAVGLTLFNSVQATRVSQQAGQAKADLKPFFQPSEEVFSEGAGKLRITRVGDRTSSERSDHDSLGSIPAEILWESQFEGAKVTLQLYQSFSGWSEVSVGYRVTGWEIVGRGVRNPEAASSVFETSAIAANSYATIRMKREDSAAGQGYVFFTAFDNEGKLVPAPTATASLANRIRRRIGYLDEPVKKPTAVFQMLIVSPEKLSVSSRKYLESSFVELREVLLAELLGQLNGDGLESIGLTSGGQADASEETVPDQIGELE